jgi:hypothetical protein
VAEFQWGIPGSSPTQPAQLDSGKVNASTKGVAYAANFSNRRRAGLGSEFSSILSIVSSISFVPSISFEC